MAKNHVLRLDGAGSKDYALLKKLAELAYDRALNPSGGAKAAGSEPNKCDEDPNCSYQGAEEINNVEYHVYLCGTEIVVYPA